MKSEKNPLTITTLYAIHNLSNEVTKSRFGIKYNSSYKDLARQFISIFSTSQVHWKQQIDYIFTKRHLFALLIKIFLVEYYCKVKDKSVTAAMLTNILEYLWETNCMQYGFDFSNEQEFYDFFIFTIGMYLLHDEGKESEAFLKFYKNIIDAKVKNDPNVWVISEEFITGCVQFFSFDLLSYKSFVENVLENGTGIKHPVSYNNSEYYEKIQRMIVDSLYVPNFHT